MSLIVGIDVGRKSAHDAVILRRETSTSVGSSFRFTSTPAGIDRLFRKIAAVRQGEELLEFVADSPGRAWVPVVATLLTKGFTVYRPSAYRVQKLRQAGHRKNKSNRIDALTLARCLMNYPDDTMRVVLPSDIQATLDQQVRQRDRVVDSSRRRKQRIQDLCEAINPGLSKAGVFLFTQAGRAFLRTYLDPRSVVRLGKKRLQRFLEKRHHGPLDPKIVETIFRSCTDANELYAPVREAGLLPFDAQALQDELNWELDQLEREEERIRMLDKQIVALNHQLDPYEVLQSIPGISDTLAAGIRSCVIDIDRFENMTKHKGFAGFYPSVRSTGDRRSSGERISKMSCNRYKRYLYLAAENAYKWDLEMAACYHKRRQKGHTHTQAVCAVANSKIVPRVHRLMKEEKQAAIQHRMRQRYVFRDLSGYPISKAEAKAIIKATWPKTNSAKK